MKTLIQHVSVFNGFDPKLDAGANIVIEDGFVTEILHGAVETGGFDQVIDGDGRTAMPGMMDAHTHLGLCVTDEEMSQMRIDELAIRSTIYAKSMLERGFTSVRDAGGMVVGLKSEIDRGTIAGPKIFPSHACISQTCGHADERRSRADERLGDGSYTAMAMRNGGMVIADGVPEVMRAVRQQLFLGASQIKIMAGGGLSSKFDNFYTTQYTFEELKAAVDCASDYGTYVMTHIYTPECMQRAAKAGVRSFEHATLMDEETAKLVKDSGIWVCPGPQFAGNEPHKNGPPPKITGREVPRHVILNGEQQLTDLINKYDIPIVYGTDASRPLATVEFRQYDDIRKFKRRFGSLKTIRAMTGNTYELGKLCTYQHPYPDGKLGVLEVGSYADLLLVQGNPVEDVEILAEQTNIQLVMKDGVVYKNTL